MENTSGFYQVGIASSVFPYAPNLVMFPDGTSITKEKKNTYTYPINGWVWYDSIEDAYGSQGLVYTPDLTKDKKRLRR